MTSLRGGVAAIVVSLTTGTAQAQFGVPWPSIPAITVISAQGAARLALVDEAVANTPRRFPLTEAERRQLLELYPPGWKAKAP